MIPVTVQVTVVPGGLGHVQVPVQVPGAGTASGTRTCRAPCAPGSAGRSRARGTVTASVGAGGLPVRPGRPLAGRLGQPWRRHGLVKVASSGRAGQWHSLSIRRRRRRSPWQPPRPPSWWIQLAPVSLCAVAETQSNENPEILAAPGPGRGGLRLPVRRSDRRPGRGGAGTRALRIAGVARCGRGSDIVDS